MYESPRNEEEKTINIGEEKLRADLAAARDANNAYRAAFSTNKVHTTAQAEADSNGKAFVTAAKSVLTA